MNIKEGYSKKVTFDIMDSIEQKIDKLTVMMGKLVTEEGQNRQFKPWVYQSNRGRGQTRCNYEQRRFQDRFRSNNAYRVRSRYGQNYRHRLRYNSTYRVVMDIIREVIWDKGDRIIITEGKTLEIKIMIGIGVGHMRDTTETEGIKEALVIVDQGQVWEQVQIGIGLNVLSVENMTISQEIVQQHRQAEK